MQTNQTPNISLNSDGRRLGWAAGRAGKRLFFGHRRRGPPVILNVRPHVKPVP